MATAGEKDTIPKFKKDAFQCPRCNTYAHMTWLNLKANTFSTSIYEATCSRCQKPSLWRVTKTGISQNVTLDLEGELVFPDNTFSVLPEKDMPEDVKIDYMEASRVFSRSPRSAAALLRLGLQKLCKHLGEDGKNINDDIRSLAANNTLPPDVIKVADTVRITGNNAVHPGEMSSEDVDHIASKMFYLLNFIVRKGISEPKELEGLYSMTPEGPRKSAEAKDAKARKK